MTNKTAVFFKDHLDKLPFFLRNHKIKNLQTSADVDKTNNPTSYDTMPVYHSEFVECKLPNKPISKMLTFDEQKEF